MHLDNLLHAKCGLGPGDGTWVPFPSIISHHFHPEVKMKKFVNIKKLQKADTKEVHGGNVVLYGIPMICRICGKPIYPGKPHYWHMILLYGITPVNTNE